MVAFEQFDGILAELDAKRQDVRSIVIQGRRWFERTNGNTYFSAVGIVDGEVKVSLGFRYGYGDQYAWETWIALEAAGAIPPIERRNREIGGSAPVREIAESPWSYAERIGAKLVYSAADVSRKRDL